MILTCANKSIVTPHEAQGPLLKDDGHPSQFQTSCHSIDPCRELQQDHEFDVVLRNHSQASAITSFSPPASSHDISQLDSIAAEPRISLATPMPFGLHSPPPSPGFVPLPLCPLSEDLTRYNSVDTPPPSRRASLPSVLVRETPPCVDDDDVSSEIQGLQISGLDSPLDSRYSNPFVGAPYVKTPCYIDYGVSLKIASSTFVNRNFTVVDSPAGTYSVGERCLIGPNVTLAGVGHPLGMQCVQYSHDRADTFQYIPEKSTPHSNYQAFPSTSCPKVG
jgi:hypothetical protein